MLNFIDGGVCAAQGFKAAGIHVGVKTHATWKEDVALIVSDADCAAAAVFTKNVVKAAPIHVDKAHLLDGHARAIIANSGNANARAPHGEENAEKMCAAAAKAIGCRQEDVLVSSTGVIGQTLNVQVIEEGVPALYAALEHSDAASDAAAHAIMTTDTVKKEAAVETVIGGKTVRIGGIAKGSGMIHPNTLKSMDTTGVVTYMGSFSKVLSPGIRLGWMLASRELIEKYESAKECADLQASTLTQMVVDTYLAHNDLDENIQRLNELYRGRRDKMLALLAAEFPEGSRWTHPCGGLFLWATLPEGIDTDALLSTTVAHKAAYIPGRAFFADGDECRCLRLNFSNASEAQMEQGIAIMGQVFRDALAKG